MGNRQRHVIAAAGLGDVGEPLLQLLVIAQIQQSGAELQIVGVGGAGFAHAIGAEHQGLQIRLRLQRMQLGALVPELLIELLAEAAGGFAAALLALLAQQRSVALLIDGAPPI